MVFLEEKGNGRVLVVDGGASLRCAILGGNPVVQAQNNGWAGIIVNGCIRDVDEINGCDIGVRALASHPMKANKKGMGEKHVPINIAGTRICDGEWLYADTDGILISRTELGCPLPEMWNCGNLEKNMKRRYIKVQTHGKCELSGTHTHNIEDPVMTRLVFRGVFRSGTCQVQSMKPQWDVLNPKWTFGSKPRPKNPHVRLSSSLFERAPLPGPGEILNATLLHLRLQTELRRCIPRSIPSYASAFFVYAYASRDGGNGLLKELSNCQPPPSSMREDSTPARYGLALVSSYRKRCEGETPMPASFRDEDQPLLSTSGANPCSKQSLSLYETTPRFKSMAEHQKEGFILPTPVAKLISFQTDLIYNGLLSLLSPFYSLFSVASNSYHRAEETEEYVESAVQRAPSQITHATALLLKKLGLCLLTAAYVCIILILVLVLATVVGVGLVRLWVEEPVSVKEYLHFDYAQAHPTALFYFNGVKSYKGHLKKKNISVPVGHSFFASLVLVMPESDFNRELGMFQLTAELLSANGNVIAKSSQPCMLRFRSSPIRLARTIMMGVPLVLGISGETQNINVEILRHKEDYRRSNAIKVTLHPRAGTSYLPQLYEANVMINSHLPWTKELVRNWKWTFYVWVSLYVYILLLMFLLCCYRPLIFLVTPKYSSDHRVSALAREEPGEIQVGELGDESDVSELLRKWRSSRDKRKTILAHGGVPETVVGSSASRISMTTREDITSVAVEDDVEDSESVCIG
ncbi:hypothetical protein VNO78_15197 [Psophocarpus tetragonolobus]|uniref:4-hydroxy-4-methyl-2-oxoglutarate aldolase n=1 Tax=Psophocarpus tetragonolobus TaxID=3891 RepID=A0AAN9XIZ6_PSOTE